MSALKPLFGKRGNDLLRDHHFRQGKTVENRPLNALLNITDIVQHDTLSVIEPNMELPILPLQLPSLELKTHTLRLGNMNGLQIRSVTTHLLNPLRMIINTPPLLGHRPPNLRNINSNDLLLIRVEDGTEIKRILVLTVVHVGTVVHERLLQTDGRAEAFIKADCPGVAVDLRHGLGGDAAEGALFDYAGVGAADMFHGHEFFECDLMSSAPFLLKWSGAEI